MPTGTIYKYNKNRKFSVIRPDNWKTGLIDVLFETITFDAKLGDRVEYDQIQIKSKRYAQNLKKIG
jgi:cold shock CspA family protein